MTRAPRPIFIMPISPSAVRVPAAATSEVDDEDVYVGAFPDQLCWRMQARVQSEWFLRLQRVSGLWRTRQEHHVPTAGGNYAWKHDEIMAGQQCVTKCLLPGAGYARVKPIRVGDVLRPNDVNLRSGVDFYRGQHMRYPIQRRKALVDRHLQDRSRRIKRAIDRANAPAVPAAAEPEGALAGVPSGRERFLIEPPGNQLATAQGRRQRRHA